jgi:hypothetical protein
VNIEATTTMTPIIDSRGVSPGSMTSVAGPHSALYVPFQQHILQVPFFFLSTLSPCLQYRTCGGDKQNIPSCSSISDMMSANMGHCSYSWLVGNFPDPRVCFFLCQVWKWKVKVHFYVLPLLFHTSEKLRPIFKFVSESCCSLSFFVNRWYFLHFNSNIYL